MIIDDERDQDELTNEYLFDEMPRGELQLQRPPADSFESVIAKHIEIRDKENYVVLRDAHVDHIWARAGDE